VIVYIAINKLNNHRYVGQTSKLLKIRQREHKYYASKPNHKAHKGFQRAIAKYGFDVFEWEIVFESNDQNLVDEAEMYYIKLYNTKGHDGYNETAGGEHQRGASNANYRGGPVEVKCAGCGKIYSVERKKYNHNQKKNLQFCCSYKCSGIWKSKMSAERKIQHVS
jgi:group I intron endonuclease